MKKVGVIKRKGERGRVEKRVRERIVKRKEGVKQKRMVKNKGLTP